MIRIATTADVPEMLAIYTPYVENTTVSFEYVPPTLEEFTNRFTTYTRQFPWLVWEEGGVLLGYAYASAPFSRAAAGWCAEPTVYLRPEARGKGIGRALYDVLEGDLNAIHFIGIDAMAHKGGGMPMVRDGELMASYIYPTRGDKVMKLADRKSTRLNSSH